VRIEPFHPEGESKMRFRLNSSCPLGDMQSAMSEMSFTTHTEQKRAEQRIM